MPRNIERDEKEAMRRKEQLMEAGFRLFFAIWDRECQLTKSGGRCGSGRCDPI